MEIISAREVPLGSLRAMKVYRTLPHRERTMIGAWCFVDHYGPEETAMDVAPHPHTGLQTVSWLFEGTIMHHDSADNHVVVAPGEVNLMTAGAGICHSETSTTDTTILHGVQLWTALPDAARHTTRRFDHFAPPITPIAGGELLVFLGALAGATSPVPTFSPLLGAELRVFAHQTVTLTLDPSFEHGVLVDDGLITINGQSVARTELLFSPVGETQLRITNSGDHTARLIVIGGTPFEEEIVMWWNFIGRSSDEIKHYRAEWEAGSERFGTTRGYIARNPVGKARIPAPQLPPVELKPRGNTPRMRPL